ncbi:carboxypeptidase B [Anabrus simplex]|uniref:carboxypeptidase B n=1 Tax=Anabrus simplex TaxID=316456 RepID=UPI0035A2EAF5
MARAAVLWVCLGFLAGLSVGAEDQELPVSYRGAQLLRLNLPSPSAHSLVEGLVDEGEVQLWRDREVNGTELDILVKPDALPVVQERLKNESIEYDVVIADLQEAIEQENSLVSESDLDVLMGRNGHRMEWQSYHRLQDIHHYLDFLAQTYPNLCSVQTIGSSLGGRPLKVLRIASDKPNSPAIWLDGGIHAREWISPASVTYIINQLTEYREQHGDAVQSVEWYILPVVNPDGYEHSHTGDRLWRKNRRSNGQGCLGVDLNRNFGYKWGGAGSSRRPCDEIYAGAHAFSEPETSAIQGFVKSHQAIKAYVSYHSYGQYILYPWGYASYVPPDHTDLSKVGNKMAQAMASAGGGSYRVGSSAITLYPASGGSDDWAKGSAGVKYAYTVELRDRGRYGFVLPAQYIVPTAKEAFAAARTVAEAVLALK